VLIRGPQRRYLDWFSDSRRWDGYRPRPDDVIIASAPKCGTTWVQRIVGLLIFNDSTPRSVDEESPWVDFRLYPLEAVYQPIERQEHRRYLKAHLPLDGLPLYEEVKYIHVSRDGRDAFMSLHDMVMGFKANPMADVADPEIGKPYPTIPERPADYFRMWLTTSVNEDQTDGAPFLSFFDLEVASWAERLRSNVLLVHYSDLKADLDGEMRRIAAFLGAPIDAAKWPDLVRAATFEEMKAAGARIKPSVVDAMSGGADRFFNKGVNGRWREHLSDADLALYREKVREKFTPGLAAWIEEGRLRAGDPREIEV
jgi:aryl sulfotransferase